MKIGVVSDTHGYFDPHLPQLLQGVEEILHAGDVGSEAVLDQLRAIAPVHAVRGNIDSAVLGLAPTLTRRLGSVEHPHAARTAQAPIGIARLGAGGSLGRENRLSTAAGFWKVFREDCQVVIFGHTHEPCALILGGKLFFNPGSAGKKRFSLPRCCGLLEISPQGVQATFLGLERYNEDLPEGVWLPIGGAKAWGNC